MSEADLNIEANIKKVAEKIRQLRIDSNYSSYENFAFENEINRVQYWRVESGKNITLKTFFKILSIHNITPEEFFKDFT
ncbi:hypothetical protein DI487_13355 [Flavobacterium sediminis]|uniref:HTH cro/C1-type domain-containing protein n=1 Tax=Flavobacterium sediminis TaxID=2201181 RepID=A0A2U8QX08_9FLAO|nr:helix-turn-helix transcriptional regulator [Flavobacterium sediminis]AWM14747.1 hypothetical protein DI487_13355 [Flavobacterium sediminis]